MSTRRGFPLHLFVCYSLRLFLTLDGSNLDLSQAFTTVRDKIGQRILQG